MDLEYLSHFPIVMQKAFCKYGIWFPEGSEFCYDPVLAFRIIKRDNGQDLAVTREDFRSMAEEGRKPKRGQHPEKNPKYYGVSLFKDKTEVKYKFGLPQYPKKLAKGYVVKTCGPLLNNGENGSSHVTWWLYKDADISEGKFEVIEDE